MDDELAISDKVIINYKLTLDDKFIINDCLC